MITERCGTSKQHSAIVANIVASTLLQSHIAHEFINSNGSAKMTVTESSTRSKLKPRQRADSPHRVRLTIQTIAKTKTQQQLLQNPSTRSLVVTRVLAIQPHFSISVLVATLSFVPFALALQSSIRPLPKPWENDNRGTLDSLVAATSRECIHCESGEDRLPTAAPSLHPRKLPDISSTLVPHLSTMNARVATKMEPHNR